MVKMSKELSKTNWNLLPHDNRVGVRTGVLCPYSKICTWFTSLKISLSCTGHSGEQGGCFKNCQILGPRARGFEIGQNPICFILNDIFWTLIKSFKYCQYRTLDGKVSA